MKLILPMPPSANRYWRCWRGRMVKSREAREYQAIIKRGIPAEPMDGLICVTLAVYRARRSGDLDGRIKVILDALEGVAYHNDSQIEAIQAWRFDDPENPRIEIEIDHSWSVMDSGESLH